MRHLTDRMTGTTDHTIPTKQHALVGEDVEFSRSPSTAQHSTARGGEVTQSQKVVISHGWEDAAPSLVALTPTIKLRAGGGQWGGR